MSKGILSSKQAKEVFFKVLESHKEPTEFIDINNAQISDAAQIEEIIDQVLARSEQQINDYHNGRTNLFDYFVGQVMKETRGKANPTLTKEILNRKLNN